MRTTGIILLLLAPTLFAQFQSDRIGFGAFGSYDFNLHTADFRALPGVPNCCPRFTEGEGDGFAVGILLDIPFSGTFSLMFRASYVSHSATLASSEPQVVSVAGTPVPALIEHTLASRVSSVGLEPLLGYRLFGGFRIHAGGRLGYVLGKRFDQKETLIEPASTGTFENDMRTRNERTDKDIPDASVLYAGAMAGLSYRLPLSNDGLLQLAPEAYYTRGLTKVVEGLDWRMNDVRAGLSLIYSPLPAPPAPVKTEPEKEEPKSPKKPERIPALAAFLDVKAVEAEGRELPAAEIRVEEFVSTQVKPLLGYVFFGDNSNRLPLRYALYDNPLQQSTFSIDKLHEMSTLNVYYNLLNIVGARMTSRPTSRITLTGCNSGAEPGGLELSRSRAREVASYLEQVWGISSSRINIDARGLPMRPSSPAERDGIEENRRVEISSDDWEILRPVRTESIERLVTPPVIRFRPRAEAEAGLQMWTVSAGTAGRIMKTITGDGAPPQYVDWDTRREPESIPREDGTLNSVLTITDRASQLRRSEEIALPVRVRTVQRKREVGAGDERIDRFSLILFDFDSPEISAANRRILDEMIRPELRPGASISVNGHTDRIGDDAYNRDLSQRRADSVARMIGVRGITSKGLGESSAPYQNDLPEQRFYNRTVEIIAKSGTSVK